MEGAMSYERDVESLKATELRLGLPGTDEISSGTIRGIKRTLDGSNEDGRSETTTATEEEEEDEVAPPKAKAQVVGWPPVRSYRRNIFQARKAAEAEAAAASGGTLVKVSMDGAPYLRKIELKTYKGYKELREALESMFKSFSLGKISAAAAAEGGCSGGSEYAITYEDKDGDWMLVGDVPWGMFTSSCKRLRIMRGSEARGFGSNQ